MILVRIFWIFAPRRTIYSYQVYLLYVAHQRVSLVPL